MNSTDLQTKLERYYRDMERNLTKESDDLREWTEKLLKDPAHYMEWGTAAVNTAARIQVYWEVLNILGGDGENWTSPESPEQLLASLRSTALQNAIRGARSPEHSSAPMSNLTKTFITSEWARLYEDISWLDKA